MESEVKVVTPDRITVTYGTKIQIKEFEPKSASISYSSDAREGETAEKLLKRVSDFVADKIYDEEVELKALRKKARS